MQTKEEQNSNNSFSISDSKSTFCACELKNVHSLINKHLPIDLSHLVCDYYRDLNDCSIEIIKQIANSNDQKNSLVIDAQARLGLAYYEGIGLRMNKEEGLKLLRLVRKRKDLAAGMWALGYCYYFGIDMRTDHRKAFDYFKRSAKKGYVLSQSNLGICYKYGHGVEKNLKKAVKYYLMASKQGLSIAQFYLAGFYERMLKNETEAVKWYLRASHGGYDEAQYWLGLFYLCGQGISKDESAAFKWFMKASEQGNTYAQVFVGDCYRYGKGVAIDKREAIKWYRKAAEQGHYRAKKNLEQLVESETKQNLLNDRPCRVL